METSRKADPSRSVDAAGASEPQDPIAHPHAPVWTPELDALPATGGAATRRQVRQVLVDEEERREPEADGEVPPNLVIRPRTPKRVDAADQLGSSSSESMDSKR